MIEFEPRLFARSLRRAMIAVTMLLLAAIGVGAAEQGNWFDRTPGGLPKTVLPTHYAIELEPNLDNLSLAGLGLSTSKCGSPPTGSCSMQWG